MTASSESSSAVEEEDLGVGVDAGTLVVRRDHPNNRIRPPMGVFAQGEDADELQYFPPVDNMLGQGRVDPFSTFARQTTARENYFIDHCMYMYPINKCVALLCPISTSALSTPCHCHVVFVCS
jgi:hypothetical protein